MDKLKKTFVAGETLLAADLNEVVAKINEGVDEINILAAENMTDTIYLDFTKTSPSQIITGDVNGDVIKWIRNNSHRYLAKKTAEGKVTICQLSDGNSGIFAGDGSTAPLDGSMGDVMVHVPTFYYRVQEIADGKWEIDFSLLELGEEWNKYDGNQLLGAYEGYVNDGKLYSRSGNSTASWLFCSTPSTATPTARVLSDLERTAIRSRQVRPTASAWRTHTPRPTATPCQSISGALRTGGATSTSSSITSQSTP